MKARLIVASLFLALAACNQSGRPAPIGPNQAAINQQMGQVVDGAYVVAPGDTLAVVSERTNTPIRTLIDLNNLVPPYVIAAGQRLALQQRSHYVVRSGDTVSGLSKKLGVTQSALIQLNNLKAPYALKVGQQLNLPSRVEASSNPEPAPAAASSPNGGVSQAASPPLPNATSPASPASVPASAPVAMPNPAPQPPSQPQPQAGAKPLASDEPISPTPATPQPAVTQTAAAPTPAAPVKTLEPPADEPVAKPLVNGGAGKFGWPVQGKVIGKFGGGSDGLKNDGINIAAPVGAPVNAAADGVVAYAGNQLRGFGNMILIRHADGYVTAYAHNQSLLVQKGAKVKRGQTIARVGSTGNVDSPQLHFEIRKGTQPVDPLTLLGS